MVLDSSAIVAVMLDEPQGAQLTGRIAAASLVLVAAPTVLEAVLVLSSRLRVDARSLVEGVLREAGAQVVPFDHDHYLAAASAWLKYGKGRHPAALNFGDCLSYGLAKVSGLPLLCVGSDFPQTDITLA